MGRKLNISSVQGRLIQTIQGELEFSCLDALEQLSPKVESEIELLLAGTFKMIGRLADAKILFGGNNEGEEAPLVTITPQFEWDRYRIDFCFRLKRTDRVVFVECDGHEFHERTPEQAERDRSKDRAIQAAGIPILRFTGREIWRDPVAVALEIFKALKF